jgi:hydrogenase nickel incorporation protein HypA/HybF
VHELSISSAVVDTAIKHAAGRPVTAVTMTVGALRQVVPESLEFYFGIVSRDTLCEGARLEQVFVPARVRCSSCGHERELDELPVFLCPECGGTCEVSAGNELEVESIEVKDKEDACTAPA